MTVHRGLTRPFPLCARQSCRSGSRASTSRASPLSCVHAYLVIKQATTDATPFPRALSVHRPADQPLPAACQCVPQLAHSLAPSRDNLLTGAALLLSTAGVTVVTAMAMAWLSDGLLRGELRSLAPCRSSSRSLSDAPPLLLFLQALAGPSRSSARDGPSRPPSSCSASASTSIASSTSVRPLAGLDPPLPFARLTLSPTSSADLYYSFGVLGGQSGMILTWINECVIPASSSAFVGRLLTRSSLVGSARTTRKSARWPLAPRTTLPSTSTPESSRFERDVLTAHLPPLSPSLALSLMQIWGASSVLPHST